MTQHPYQSADEDPLQVLCHFFNVAKTEALRPSQLTKTYDLTISRNSNLPTHILAVFDTPLSDPYAQMTMIPIDITIFTRKLRADILGPRAPTASRNSVLRQDPRTRSFTITVPVMPLQVPHAPSVPLLLLFALGIRCDPSALAAHLLPLAAIEEFPSAAAMAQVMASCCDNDRLSRYTAYNQGVWKNVLAMGPQNADVMGVVQTVWNVTAEARRIWLREKERKERRRRSTTGRDR